MRFRVLRVGTNAAPESFNCPIHITRSAEKEPKVIERSGMGRSIGDTLPEIRDGFLDLIGFLRTITLRTGQDND